MHTFAAAGFTKELEKALVGVEPLEVNSSSAEVTVIQPTKELEKALVGVEPYEVNSSSAEVSVIQPTFPMEGWFIRYVYFFACINFLMIDTAHFVNYIYAE